MMAKDEMIKKIEKELYDMWLFREKSSCREMYDYENARLSGAVSMLKAIGYEVYFNPLAENENPYKVKESE